MSDKIARLLSISRGVGGDNAIYLGSNGDHITVCVDNGFMKNGYGTTVLVGASICVEFGKSNGYDRYVTPAEALSIVGYEVHGDVDFLELTNAKDSKKRIVGMSSLRHTTLYNFPYKNLSPERLFFYYHKVAEIVDNSADGGYHRMMIAKCKVTMRVIRERYDFLCGDENTTRLRGKSFQYDPTKTDLKTWILAARSALDELERYARDIDALSAPLKDARFYIEGDATTKEIYVFAVV